MIRFTRTFAREPRRVVGLLWPLALLAPFLPFLPRPHNGGPTWRQESTIALLLSVTFALLLRGALRARSRRGDAQQRPAPPSSDSSGRTSVFDGMSFLLAAPLAAFVLWSAASTFWASNLFPAAHYALSWTTYLLFFQAVRGSAGPRLLRNSLALLALTVIIISAANVVGYYGSPDSFISQNGLGEPVAVSIPLFAALALRIRKRRAALLCGAAATIAWLSMLEIAERAPFFGVCTGLFVLCASMLARRQFRPRGLRRAALLASAFAACALLQTVPSPFAESRQEPVFVRLQKTSTTEINTRARMLFWGAAVEMWRARPLTGVGAGGYDGAYPSARVSFVERHPDSPLVEINERYLSSGAHNEYLQMLGELGAVGLALFVAFCCGLLWAAWRALRVSSSPLAPGAVAALAAFAVSSGASSISFRWFGSGLMFFFAAALVACLAAAGARRDSTASGRETRPLPSSLAPRRYARRYALGLCVSLFIFASMCVQATNVLLLATAQASADASRADGLFRSALSLNPIDASTHYNYGVWLAARGRDEEAVPHLRYALARGFHSSTCYEYLAGAETNAGDAAAAERTLAAGARVYPRSVLMRAHHSIALKNLGRADEAGMEMAAALLLDSRAARGWQQLIENDIDAAADAAKRDSSVAMPGELQPEEAVFAVLLQNERRFPQAAASGWRARMFSKVQ